MKLIFATNNLHKIEEVQLILGEYPGIQIITLKEAGIEIDIPEPHHTLEANASEKSKTIYELTRSNCFSEDTGLEVVALKGEPGVRSARYADDEAGDVTRMPQKNIEKLLKKLEGIIDRRARFRTVISLIIDGTEKLFEGVCEGTIIEFPKGGKGFGYDPVFQPVGSVLTFAEMSTEEKNRFSHRKKATDNLAAYLNGINKNSNI